MPTPCAARPSPARFLATAAPLLAALLLLTPKASAIAEPVPKGAVVVAPLQGEVSEAQVLILRRALKNAEAANAAAFVINMDTPGGSLAAAVKILDMLLKTPLPTITWVNTNAGSAGALIALGTKKIIMAPVSAIGAAAPVMGGGQEIPETLSAKIISYYSGYFRSAAEANGYNPELAEAFINRDKELKIGNEVISPKGSLLTLSAQEAARKIDGKPILASGIAANLTQLTDLAGLENAPLYEFQPSGFEKIAKWITTLAPLFLLGGIIGAYLEFKSPGFGVPGLISALCFLLFFAGHYIAGLTGFEAAALFVLGILLILFELIFFPGILIPSLLGVALMLVGLLFAMVDYWPSRGMSWDFATLGPPVFKLAASLIVAATAAALLARFLPSLPWLSFLFLRAQTASGPAVPAHPRSLDRRQLAPGQTGKTLTILRPTGRAEFDGIISDVVTDGEFLPAGTPVRIERIEGTRVIVSAL